MQSIEVDVDLALELLAISDKYREAQLAKFCEDLLIENLNSGNCVEMIQKANVLGSEDLREASLDFITKNINSLSSETLKELDKDLLIELLKFNSAGKK